jgi:hypothetical protein
MMTAIIIDNRRPLLSAMRPKSQLPTGRTTYSELPPFCEVSAVLTPTSDSLINMELWMPTTTWNARFEGTGNGVMPAPSRYRCPR